MTGGKVPDAKRRKTESSAAKTSTNAETVKLPSPVVNEPKKSSDTNEKTAIKEPASEKADEVEVIDLEEGTKVMSIDIEAMRQGDKFPQSHQDPVVQISSVCATIYDDDEIEIENYVFTWGTCLPVENATIIECKDEATLLMKWQELVLKFDPDIMIGFYFQNFDLRYMIERSLKLKLPKFLYFGRHSDIPVTTTGYDRPRVDSVNGRRLIDIHTFVSNKYYNLESYKLDFLAEYFLGDEWGCIDYSQIPYLHRTSADTRRILANFCLKDAQLAFDLFKKLDCMNPSAKRKRSYAAQFHRCGYDDSDESEIELEDEEEEEDDDDEEKEEEEGEDSGCGYDRLAFYRTIMSPEKFHKKFGRYM